MRKSSNKLKTFKVSDRLKNTLVKFLSESDNLNRLVSMSICTDKLIRILEMNEPKYFISYDNEYILVDLKKKEAISFGTVFNTELQSSKDIPWETKCPKK
jgi:hypothetical protein